jgi:hypothetical protein
MQSQFDIHTPGLTSIMCGSDIGATGRTIPFGMTL